MNTFMKGFGDVAVQSAAVSQPSVWDKVGNILTNVVQPAANIYTQVKTGQQQQPAGTVVSNPTMYPQQMPVNTPPPPPAVDNTKKYMLIGGVGILAVVGIYFATRKKKK